MRKISVAFPVLNGNEKKYVNDCLDTTWISSAGKYTEAFEKGFAEFCDTKHAIGFCNGTVSLHAALLALGIGAGDEVIVPTLTYIASANTVAYCGAKPVFVESLESTWNLDPEKLEAAITPRTKAIMPVHLYGLMCDMGPIMDIAKKHGLYIIEDAAEAHGATYKGKRSGSFGHVNSFSLFGNKIITTGEGGLLTLNDDDIAVQIRTLKGQGMSPTKRYWFNEVGYNYRMTNIQAAIGLAQLENIDWHLAQRERVAKLYQKALGNYRDLFAEQQVGDDFEHVYWMYSIALTDKCKLSRDDLMAKLAQAGIETRPVFYPMHIMPPYYDAGASFPVAERIAERGINLPTHALLTEEDVEYVAKTLIAAVTANA